MCQMCPRHVGIKRYWSLPHWSTPKDAKMLLKLKTLAYDNPSTFKEFDCSCGFQHAMMEMWRLELPLLVDGVYANYFGQCPNTRQLVTAFRERLEENRYARKHAENVPANRTSVDGSSY